MNFKRLHESMMTSRLSLPRIPFSVEGLDLFLYMTKKPNVIHSCKVQIVRQRKTDKFVLGVIDASGTVLWNEHMGQFLKDFPSVTAKVLTAALTKLQESA